MSEPTRRRVTTAPGIELEVLDSGSGPDQTVVLLHGFPETGHSWRHQIGPLIDAGLRVIVPDQRGFGSSSSPQGTSEYRADHLTGDIAAVLDDAGVDDAIVIGHDWGAIVAWHMAQLHPERCRAVIAASVPWTPWPAAPTELLRAVHGDSFFYILHFQQPQVAETEMEDDIERFLLSIIWAASAEGMATHDPTPLPAVGTTVTEAFEHQSGGRRSGPPPWLSDAELAVYIEQFRTSGFSGPVNWYRNFDANHELTAALGATPITMPTYFVAGAVDPVVRGRDEYLARMDTDLPNHRATVLIPGVGHWVQQEAPEEFNRVVLGFIEQIG